MSKNLNLEKYQKVSRIVQKLMKLSFGASVAAAVVTFIFGVIFQFASPTSNIFSSGAATSLNVSLDGVLRYRFNADISPEKMKPIMTAIMFMVFALSLTAASIFKQLVSILGTIKENKPFAQENVKRISRIGRTLIVGAFVIRIAEGIVAMNIVNNLNLNNFDVNFAPSGDMILMGFIMFILAGVFKYGCYLQKEYDSTV